MQIKYTDKEGKKHEVEVLSLQIKDTFYISENILNRSLIVSKFIKDFETITIFPISSTSIEIK